MTRSFGDPGGNPPPPGEGRRWKTPAEQEQSQQSQPSQEPKPAELNKRAVALVIDVAASYFLAAIVALLPFVGAFLSIEIIMCMYLLTRDFLFEGRGIGKNLMGLQVVNVHTGAPASLLESVIRNVILLAPFIVLQAVSIVLRIVPLPWVTSSVISIVNLAGTVYCIVVMPLEAYRVYTRADGLRFGDEFAGTEVVEAPMDFSHIFPQNH